MRVLGREPLPTGVDSAVEAAVSSELEVSEEKPDSTAVEELVRAELQKILLERQDVLERLALGAHPATTEPVEEHVREINALEDVQGPAIATGPPELFSPEPSFDEDDEEHHDERLAQMQTEIERYKRRVTKLCGSLERAEAALLKFSEHGTQISGIPSVYRTVQGLSNSDENFLVKHDALSKNFEANLALRKGLAS